MSMSLLSTKLHRPLRLTDQVERPGLRRKLRFSLQRKVTLVSAPVGFGKTALLSDWCDRCECASAWLALDEGDNDPVRFWSYFLAGLRTLYPGPAEHGGFHGNTTQAILYASHPPPIEALMIELVNELVGCTGGGIFVLDDFHTIHEQPIHDALIFLLEHLPVGLHLAIATRQDPPWPLARLRASGQMLELRAADLRFSMEESAAFFNGVERLGLLPSDIALLHSRLEGWVAGLQLVALSLREQSEITSFIDNLRGSERFVLDYLLDEVLLRQPEPLQNFLIKTSILNRLCPELCDAVVGSAEAEACRQIVQARAPELSKERPASEAVLHYLEQTNLFLTPLDNERCWYRYHHLFADLLQSHVEQRWPGERAELHRRASCWYEQHGITTDAITHALAANDLEGVTRLLEGNALFTVFQGELSQLTHWLNALPATLIYTRPWLSIARGWVLALTGQFLELETHLERAEDTIRNHTIQPSRPVDMRGGSAILAHLYALKMYAGAVAMNVDTAFHYADLALRQMPKEPSPLSDYVNLMLGSLHHRRGDLAAAEEQWFTHVTRCRAAGDLLNTVSGLAELAEMQIEQGQLHRAHVTCREALQLAGGQAESEMYHVSFVGRIYLILAKLHLEWNELEGALQMAHQGKETATRWGQAEGMLQAYTTLAHALQAVGDAEGALAAMGSAGEVARLLSPWHVHMQRAEEAQLWIAQGNIAAAVTWADRSGLSLKDSPGYLRHGEYLTLAQVRLLQYRPLPTHPGGSDQIDALIALLDQLLDLCTATGSAGTAIRVLVMSAVAHLARRDEDQALTTLTQALERAEPEGYVAAFLTARSACVPLLQRWATLYGETTYITKLLHVAYNRHAFDTGQRSEEELPRLYESLSEREQTILTFLPSNLSTVEIAQQLVLAPSTIRSHVKSIYAKLQAHSRSEALETARRLGLL